MRFTDLGRFNIDGNARREDGGLIGTGRAPGLHLSDIIGEMRREAGLPMGGTPGEQEWLAAQDGFLWEYGLELYAGGMGLDAAMQIAFKRYMLQCRAGITKQLVCEKGGIHMSPDGYDPGPPRTLESYKRTKKSMRKAESAEAFTEHFWPWIVQESCYVLGLRDAGVEVDRVLYIVYWVNGDYRWEKGTSHDVRQYEVIFDERDLDAAWSQVQRQLMKMRNKAGAASVTPA